MLDRVRGGLRRLRGFLVELPNLFIRLEQLHEQAAGLSNSLIRVLMRVDQVELGIAARFDQVVAEQMQVMRRIQQVELGIAARFDQVVAGQAQLTGPNDPLVTAVAEEVDRLDSYLVHHAAMLRSDLASTHDDLREHATALRRRVDATREAVESLHGPVLAFARTSERTYVAEGMDALLISSNFDLIVPTQEAGLLAYLCRHGVEAIEPGVRAVIRDRLQPGAMVVDAGANVGILALTMASAIGEDGQVFCFEPLPHLAQALSRTLRLNGFGGRVQVEQVALADAPGETVLNRAEHGPTSSLYALPDSMGADTIPVRLMTLDGYFAPGSRVDFVKIDVEGAEPRVWRGMQRVLAENAEIEIILEWSASHFERSREDPVRFVREIRAARFTPFLIDHDGSLRPLPHLGEGGGPLEACNLLLTRSPVELQSTAWGG